MAKNSEAAREKTVLSSVAAGILALQECNYSLSYCQPAFHGFIPRVKLLNRA
jgi:hypothetical protein